MSMTTIDFIAAGGNRHPAAADWKPGVLAFGSGNNIALWNPEDSTQRGIFALLSGHKDAVNAVKILDGKDGRVVLSGSADKTIRICGQDGGEWSERQVLKEHTGSVNVIAVLEEEQLFVSGAADGIVKVWEMQDGLFRPTQSIQVKPKFLPLTLALHRLPTGDVVLAVSGTCHYIQLYVRPRDSKDFELQATLSGHEGWVRSLDFTQETGSNESDILLASASQDKYIRLWRLRKPTKYSEPTTNGSIEGLVATAKKSLSNKSHQVGSPDNKYNVTFEALLIGHEDWIYTARWAPPSPDQTSPTLLSASADNSLAIWRADSTSGVWICETRLGDISSQKGSTTATGSTGGFWIGLWQPNGRGVVSLGRTGSWRRWVHDIAVDPWTQRVGITGHTQEVKSLAWSKDSSYLLSTGADQTTRMLAEWTSDAETRQSRQSTWHEFSRPQIHGYDLNCIDSVFPGQFISGADEKLLRVFNLPSAIDALRSKLSNNQHHYTNGALPEAAAIPVLGLSNKAITSASAEEEPDGVLTNGHTDDEPPPPPKPSLDLTHPPLEEHLARHTLWPEHEKLYGHGYEISAVACSPSGDVVATACKASSLEHGVIRLYECKDWREIKPALQAHSLTVTSQKFSPDGRFLLSVGRDRNVALCKRKEEGLGYERCWCKEKAHSRMCLDCCWMPVNPGNEADNAFVTVGRDKKVKLWSWPEGDGEPRCVRTIDAEAPVTAVDCISSSQDPQVVRLAYGMENGSIKVATIERAGWEVVSSHEIEKRLSPSGGVNALRWRPSSDGGKKEDGEIEDALQLAVASEDVSVRILSVGPP